MKENVFSYLIIGALSFIISQFANYVTTSSRIAIIETKIDNIISSTDDINVKLGTTDAKMMIIQTKMGMLEGKVSVLLGR